MIAPRDDAAARLSLVRARIEFFGTDSLRQHYTGFLRELEDQKRALEQEVASNDRGAWTCAAFGATS